MNKNEDIEVFASGVKSLAEHSLQDFSAHTRDEILGEMAKNNMLKELLAGSKHIDLWAQIAPLNNATFHEWLLTNPDEMAFEIWLRVRDREIRSKSYKEINYEDSAALIMYANLPQRLRLLIDKEWNGRIIVSSLLAKKIPFIFNSKTTETAKQKISHVVLSGHVYSQDSHLMAIDIASIRGDIGLIETAIGKNRQLSKMHKLSVIGEKTIDIKSILEIMKNHYSKEAYEEHKLVDLFKYAALYGNKNQLEKIWFEMSETSKGLFMQTMVIGNRSLDIILSSNLEEERIDILDYLLSLKTKTGISIAKGFKVNKLWDCVNSGKKRSVKFILKHNPELLEEKDWVYHSPPHKKKGTALTFAINNSNFEMATFLLSCGAKIDTIKELLSYKPFLQDKWASSEGIEFITNIENFILKQQVKNNNEALDSNNRKAMDLMAL